MHAFPLLAGSHAHAMLPSAPEVNRVGSLPGKPPTLRPHPHVPLYSHHTATGVTQPVEAARAISFMLSSCSPAELRALPECRRDGGEKVRT